MPVFALDDEELRVLLAVSADKGLVPGGE